MLFTLLSDAGDGLHTDRGSFTLRIGASQASYLHLHHHIARFITIAFSACAGPVRYVIFLATHTLCQEWFLLHFVPPLRRLRGWCAVP